ncbi:MAG: class II aldolase/adducin family protein [Pseudomonadota bacterium]|nr:class II aldolase/adducin family protein [Pseudomonadota bacterium]
MIKTRLKKVDEIKHDLAFAHQLFAVFGWDDLTYTHLTARNPERDSYFIMPFGHVFSEVTADQLLEIDFSGKVINGNPRAYNPTGHVIHGSIYQIRRDVNAVFHSHTPCNVAVATQTDGLLPISQWGLLFYERFGFHEYDSLALHAQVQGSQLIQDLADYPVLLMRNHGVVVAGKDIAESFYMHYHLEMACQTQCRLLAMGQTFSKPSHEVCRRSCKDLNNFETQNGQRDWAALKRKYRHLDKSFFNCEGEL